ncbi:MAG: hypothetical protein GWO24_11515, partial [Akkermansiaceae bacterium]|nr:hypothetical protein [Akkermansiaceae bacterium]
EVGSIYRGQGVEALPVPVAHWKFDGSIENEATFTPEQSRNRIVLVGGTLISRMDAHG